MDNLLQLGLRFQTIFSGIHFLFHLFSWPFIIGFLKDYQNQDRLNFNCMPKPSDFTRQRCYDNYISTLSPLLTPLDFAGITYGALGFLWVLFILTGAWLRRRIKKLRNGQRNQSRIFTLVFVCHFCFQFLLLTVIMGLFCSCQSLSFPAEFNCYQSNTTLTPPNQEAGNMTCNDLRYKEKSNLNIAIIVIMALSILCCILTVIHVVAKRKTFIELGDVFAQGENSETGINLEGKHSISF